MQQLIEIFGRDAEYDTASDPIVRVTAAEIRKRVAQYYQDPTHDQELRIALPSRSYIPQFHWPKGAADPVLKEMAVDAAEDAARFLHHACRGLPHRVNGQGAGGSASDRIPTVDHFYAQVIEHALADFGSRVLYPSRTLPDSNRVPLSKTGFDKAALTAIQGDGGKVDSVTRELGYRLGSMLYASYLQGKIKPAALRRLFLAHLDKPESARRVCRSLIAKLRFCSITSVAENQ